MEGIDWGGGDTRQEGQEIFKPPKTRSQESELCSRLPHTQKKKPCNFPPDVWRKNWGHSPNLYRPGQSCQRHQHKPGHTDGAPTKSPGKMGKLTSPPSSWEQPRNSHLMKHSQGMKSMWVILHLQFSFARSMAHFTVESDFNEFPPKRLESEFLIFILEEVGLKQVIHNIINITLFI